MMARSLSRRLLAGAALWVTAALVIAGCVLFLLFRNHVTGALVARLGADLIQIAAALELGPDGAPQLTRRPAEPLFEKPYSGRYWQVTAPAGPTLRSRSLWDAVLDLPPDELPDGAHHTHRITGPAGQQLLVIERSVRLPAASGPMRVAVAADLAELAAPLRSFAGTLALSLAMLGLGLVAAVFLQVRYGLRPLERLRLALADLHGGQRARLKGDWPEEIQPLVQDFDSVLRHNAEVLERARTQAGNLAHALKTPISVLANAAAHPDATLPETVDAQVVAMRRHVDHHLARARAAAAAARPGAHADAVEIAWQLARTMAKLHADRAVAVEVSGADAPLFRGDPDDLTEILGNVLDNACKWANARVEIDLQKAADRLVIVVDDDGPGLPPERRGDVFVRGHRLDESVPGSGLGLSIARDLVELYEGSITLAASPRGGLRVRLELPARCKTQRSRNSAI